jgi:hypothetical protein
MSYQHSTLSSHWLETAQRLEGATDALGTPIDKDIMEAVIALNVLGVMTDSSCEGHIGRGYAAPWIDFHAVGIESLRRQASNANRNLREAEEQQAPRETIHTLTTEVYRLAREENVAYYRGSWRVYQALEAFYLEHHVPYDQQLYLHNDSFGNSRLQPNGIDYQPQRSTEIQAKKLFTYQQEMSTFAAFLKSDYLFRADSLDI